MRPSPLRSSLLAASLAATVLLAPAAPATAQEPNTCPATFQVLHDDRIGKLRLAAGAYRVTVYGGLPCARSTVLFARFLQDYDGILPRPWRLRARTATFLRGSGPRGFTVARVNRPSGGGGGGRHPASGRLCPGTFRVLHNDRIGRLVLRRGRYRVFRLSSRPSCARASRLFANFLDNDYAGILPRPWRLNVQTATFRRGKSNVGFRVKPVRG